MIISVISVSLIVVLAGLLILYMKKCIKDCMEYTIMQIFVFPLFFLSFDADYFNVTMSHNNVNSATTLAAGGGVLAAIAPAISGSVETQKVPCRVEWSHTA
ncbi:hypothetical protein ATANTOWER_011800 [Ataeniobius toweri]|uniref:Uncharacterized protein n=1 Tax=Ataeniobius toweri TaxID=208326 RepID=A0ABU7ATC1_9TELE|nr:hypothetical protein [Ataeniobius toweri]